MKNIKLETKTSMDLLSANGCYGVIRSSMKDHFLDYGTHEEVFLVNHRVTFIEQSDERNVPFNKRIPTEFIHAIFGFCRDRNSEKLYLNQREFKNGSIVNVKTAMSGDGMPLLSLTGSDIKFFNENRDYEFQINIIPKNKLSKKIREYDAIIRLTEYYKYKHHPLLAENVESIIMG